MNWFRNLKIAQKILFFNVITAMFTVILGVNGYVDLSHVPASVDTSHSKMFILANVILSLVITIPLGLHISKLVADPINKVVKNLEDISKGNLVVKDIDAKSEDETGALAKALNATVYNLHELVKEVSRSAHEISSGAKDVGAAAEQTASGSEQVSIGASQLAAGAQDQAANVNRALENISSIGRKIQRVINSSENTVELANETEDNASRGRIHAETAVGKVNQLKNSSLEVSATINELGKLGAEIELIVDLIKNIASQTNLLALNAAIEAARAGEHGKGFAVVAGEVKKLANQSAEATDKITGMIKEIQSKTGIAVTTMNKNVEEVEEGVIIIENVGQELEAILEAARNTGKHIKDISGEISRLANNADEVTRMMENISSITEESTASTEEIANVTESQTASLQEINASSDILAKVAETLNRQIAAFKI